MSRWLNISFFVYTFMLAITIFNYFNICYAYGNVYYTNIINGVDYGSVYTFNTNMCPAETGVGHMFIPFTIAQMFDASPMAYPTIHDTDNNVVDPSNFAQYNQTMQNYVAYRVAPAGITDMFGLFSWVITGLRLVFNAFFMPLFGLPQFFINNFFFPPFMAGAFGFIIFLLQISALIEFAASRFLFQ